MKVQAEKGVDMATNGSASVPGGRSAESGDGQFYDLIVIGAGSAGIAAAKAGRRSGARVLVVARGRPGQSSLWSGTIPSKALIAAARTAHLMRTADRFGITAVEPEINFGRLTETIRERITTAAPDEMIDTLRELGIELIFGSARFDSADTLMVGDRRYGFSRAVIATGSGPVMPPIPGLADSMPLTPESLWDLRFLPEHLTLIGGGPTGCELAQAIARIGGHVTIIEQAERLLPAEAREVSELITERLAAEGVEIRTGTAVRRVTTYHKHRKLSLERSDGEQDPDLEAGMIMVTAGRRAATAGLDLPKAQVVCDDLGYIRSDDRLRTSNHQVYAAGDVLGGRPLASLAELDGEIAGSNATSGKQRTVQHELAPQVVFTDPEVGRIGLTEEAARERFGDALKVRTTVGRLDRAIAEDEPAGMTKIISDGNGRLIGASVVSPRAGEVITELATVLRRGGRIRELAEVPHAYPTWSDAVWVAAMAEHAERQRTLTLRR